MRNLNSGSGMIYVNGGLKKYMVSVFNKMFFALCLTGVVSFICSSNPDVLAFMASGFSFILMLATVGIVVYMSVRINSIDSEKASALFWVYSALIGASLSPLFAIYTGESIANAFFSTAVFFGGMSLYGYTTNRDLTGVGSFMTVGLFAILITSFVNAIFMKSSGLQLGLSALSIVVFCGLTAYDIQKIKEFYSDSLDEETLRKRGVIGALSLYMDFLNIFIALLRIVGNKRQ